MSLYGLIRSLFFRFDPEDVHGTTLRALAFAATFGAGRAVLKRAFDLDDERLSVEAFGLTFRNPIGLAAGYDKDAAALVGLGCLGFGHVEVGTVTPHPQPGNPRPRVFRLPADRALINSMGFPSHGCQAIARRLAALPKDRDFLVGVNLGKNKDTPLDQAAEDYRAGVRALYARADYLSINVSSPNTQGLRQLQSRENLGALLGAITAECGVQRRATGKRMPLLVKLAPDLGWHELDDALDTLMEAGVDGLIVANTTVQRDCLRSPQRDRPGGLSGAPLAKRNLELVAYIHQQAGARLPIIAVGGIGTADDARARLEAGASLVQVYTGLIYQGPGLARGIAAGLLAPH